MTTQDSERHWAVIGAGMLGLSIAHRMAQQGIAVDVFEAAPTTGGLAAAWSLGPIVWDRHYHVMLLSDSALRQLLEELNLDQKVQWRKTRTGFFTGGKLHSLSDSLDFLRFSPLGLIDKGRLAATILYASRIKDARTLEGTPVEEWLRRFSGSVAFERIWLPLLRAKLGDNYKITSAAFIWAIIARMYAARRTGMKTEMFGYVPGGYAQVLKSLNTRLAELGVRVRTNAALDSILPSPLGLQLKFADGSSRQYANAIITLPAPIASRLCPALSAGEREQLTGIRYQGVICASVLLRKPLAGFYVTNITDSWVPFTAVIETSALVDPEQFGGKHLIYLPRYVDADDAEAFAEPDEHIRERFTAALFKMYPSLNALDIECFKISRARYVLPLPTLHYSARLPRMVTSVEGLHIVSSAHIVNGTLNVNETIRLANSFVQNLSLLTVQGLSARPVAYENETPCQPVS